MISIFNPFHRKFVLVFFYDTLVYKKSLEEHVEDVDKVLHLLKDNFFYENHSKCAFRVQEVEYLGHIVSRVSVKVDPRKIKAMRE
jgi:hypothetical protein